MTDRRCGGQTGQENSRLFGSFSVKNNFLDLIVLWAFVEFNRKIRALLFLLAQRTAFIYTASVFALMQLNWCFKPMFPLFVCDLFAGDDVTPDCDNSPQYVSLKPSLRSPVSPKSIVNISLPWPIRGQYLVSLTNQRTALCHNGQTHKTVCSWCRGNCEDGPLVIFLYWGSRFNVLQSTILHLTYLCQKC